MSTTTATESQQQQQHQKDASANPTLKLRANSSVNAQGQEEQGEEYRYAHLLPFFSEDRYPPLTPFDHADPGARALNHSNPRAFLDNATSITELTPNLGTEVHGVNLRALDSDGRDQLALEVCKPLDAESQVLIDFPFSGF
jgi:sulfonate dioxygenase